MRLIGHVQSLHRYSVKSMVGEDLRSAEVTTNGVAGDRAWTARNLEAREQQGAQAPWSPWNHSHVGRRQRRFFFGGSDDSLS